EPEARAQFIALLKSHETTADALIYVLSEREQLSLLPGHATRVLVTADLDTIKARFVKRMKGNLSAPIAAMLEKRHGMFDNEPCDLRADSTKHSVSDICDRILQC
ncbi:MAG: hypothetical protein FWC62_02950, partial [Firmicutes bacterium]|nr:hypothetical protein [Bacillota bacterium]